MSSKCKRVSGPVLTFQFLVVLNHSGIERLIHTVETGERNKRRMKKKMRGNESQFTKAAEGKQDPQGETRVVKRGGGAKPSDNAFKTHQPIYVSQMRYSGKGFCVQCTRFLMYLVPSKILRRIIERNVWIGPIYAQISKNRGKENNLMRVLNILPVI